MFLLVGLGNPSLANSKNRHNIGFMAVDRIAICYGFIGWQLKFHARVSEGIIGKERILILKSETFMNLSGKAVFEATRFYKIEPSRVIVFHDDLNLPIGNVRIKKNGGAGGHNGLRSIDANIGSDYWRIRLGIGHPGHTDLVTSWVLGDFSKIDELWLIPLLDTVVMHLPLLISGNEVEYSSVLTNDSSKTIKR
ncbi:MAG: aminoacyl-tRNA hydrolase [Rhodospirillaceae bacterium]|jgi:PTH1 family peptidyl-tRNA hydrolase|nr:aminoacyl-tRNA hydrolase [Rhodospirillaceae bacterium]